ncbi:hypothetical protein J3F84DRAFT_40735 [Trichoderma pleuroticola]
MLQEHVTLYQDEDFFFLLWGLTMFSGFHDTRGVMGGMLAGYQTKSLAQTAILTLFCAVCSFSSFFFSPRLLFIDCFQVFSFVHTGIGRILTGWVYWAGGGIVIDNSSLFCRLLCTFQLFFSRSYLFIPFVNLVFYLSLLLLFSLSFCG